MLSVLLTLSKIIPWKTSKLVFKDEGSLQLQQRWRCRCCPQLSAPCIFSLACPQSQGPCLFKVPEPEIFILLLWGRYIRSVFMWAQGAAAYMLGCLRNWQKTGFSSYLGGNLAHSYHSFSLGNADNCPKKIMTKIHRLPGCGLVRETHTEVRISLGSLQCLETSPKGMGERWVHYPMAWPWPCDSRDKPERFTALQMTTLACTITAHRPEHIPKNAWVCTVLWIRKGKEKLKEEEIETKFSLLLSLLKNMYSRMHITCPASSNSSLG